MKHNKNLNFVEAYGDAGNPGAVFDTKTGTKFSVTPISETPRSGIPEAERHSDLSGYKLLVTYAGGPVQPLKDIYLNLQITTVGERNFALDLTSDLALTLNGLTCPFTYVSKWSNNAAIIKLQAPAEAGIYQVSLRTAYLINTHNASVSFQVIEFSNGGMHLDARNITPASVRDVTIIYITARDSENRLLTDFDPNPTISTSTMGPATSPFVGTTQVFEISNPAPVITDPVWLSFYVKALHPNNFIGVSLDLRFTINGESGAEILWEMPIKLEPINNMVEIKLPLPDWDDSYTFMLDLFEVGSTPGTFSLIWNHASGLDPVSLDTFTVSGADPSRHETNVSALAQGASSSTSIQPILPVVWVNGATYLVFWADWEGGL